jgi:hypothetical protein
VDASDDEVKWLRYVVEYIDGDISIPDDVGTLIATQGYGYFLEGVNPTKPTNNILTSSDLRKVSRDGFIILPFYNNGTITSVDVNSNGSDISDNHTVTSSDNSNKAIQYLIIDVSQAPNDDSITVTFNPTNENINYEIVDECRYEPKQVVFINKYGLYDSITLFKKSNNQISVTNDDFINAYVTNGTYSTTSHQFQKINIQGEEVINCNTGYISEKENALYKELMLSEKVYFYEDGDLIPVNVASSSLEFKNRVNDGLVNYTIQFKYAYNIIQNV